MLTQVRTHFFINLCTFYLVNRSQEARVKTAIHLHHDTISLSPWKYLKYVLMGLKTWFCISELRAAFVEDPSSIASSHVHWLTTTCNFSVRDLSAQAPASVGHTLVCTHTHTSKSKMRAGVLSAHVCACVWRPVEGVISRRPGVTEGCQLQYRYWEWSPGPLVELSLQTLE